MTKTLIFHRGQFLKNNTEIELSKSIPKSNCNNLDNSYDQINVIYLAIHGDHIWAH